MLRVVLPRGINLGARNKVSMPDLRASLANSGFRVSTSLASGNIITDATAAQVRQHIVDVSGVDVECLERTRQQITDVIAANPLVDVATDPSRLYVVFLADPAADVIAEALAVRLGAEEVLEPMGAELFWWSPQGTHGSKISAAHVEKVGNTVATVRNWNTVVKIDQLMTV